MGEETRKLTGDIIDNARLVIVTIIMIVVIFLVIKSVIGDVPAYITSGIIGLGIFFACATNRKVKEQIKNWLNGKKSK